MLTLHTNNVPYTYFSIPYNILYSIFIKTQEEVIILAEQFEWALIGMTIDEAAAALRVDRKTIFKLLQQGDFPARKVGKGWRVDPDAVRAWLATGNTGQGVTDDEE